MPRDLSDELSRLPEYLYFSHLDTLRRGFAFSLSSVLVCGRYIRNETKPRINISR
jgi:hypothetical protein